MSVPFDFARSQQERQPLVSIIVPCRNEAAWIGSCLASIAASDWPKESLEVLVVDGRSDDGTGAIVSQFARRHPYVRLLENPKQIAPSAMNIALREARGAIIVRMDAHNDYPPEYVPRLVHWLQSSGADNVGGVWITRPANDTPVARAIALALSHPFGVGNARFRIGAAEPRHVDTVPFGCYRREVFDRVGVFDEELGRGQDLEFNLRLRKAGGKILLVPEIVSYYHPRDSLAKVWRMSYQNGYFNPLVMQKLGSALSLRHMIPPLFVLTLLVTGLASPWFAPAGWLLLAIAGSYLAVLLAASAAIAWKHGPRCGLMIAATFAALHFGTGLGTLHGLWHFCVLRRRGPAVNHAAAAMTR